MPDVVKQRMEMMRSVHDYASSRVVLLGNIKISWCSVVLFISPFEENVMSAALFSALLTSFKYLCLAWISSAIYCLSNLLVLCVAGKATTGNSEHH